MALELVNKENVNAPDADFPFGDVRDKTPTVGGTKYNRSTMSDYIQFFHKMMSEAGIAYNNTLDNEYSGWQFYEAFRKLTRPYKVYHAVITQAGTNAPVVSIKGVNDIGDIVWTRSNVGQYTGTLTGAFPDLKTFVFVGASLAPATVISFARNTDNTISLVTSLDVAGSIDASDSILEAAIEIRVYD
jgi:hypothetical protein